jgi:hypothetical protein
MGHPMRIILSILSLLLPAVGTAHAQAPHIERIDITEYGTYTLDREIKGRDPQGITQAAMKAARHAETRRTVPLEIGTTFGFRYKVVGTPADAAVDLTGIVVFPAPGLRPSSSRKPLSQYEVTLQARIGETSYVSYTLEDSFELVPGTWVIELWHGKRKLGWQSFSAVKPDTAVKPASVKSNPKPDIGCRGDSCEGM